LKSALFRLLSEADGALELVSVKNLLPGLVYKEGLSKWKVASKENEFFDTFEEVPDKLHSLIRCLKLAKSFG